MRSRSQLINRIVMCCLLATAVFVVPGRSRAADSDEKMQKLEGLLELAIDRFQLKDYIAARAALEKLIAENPSGEQALKLRELFGDKILLQMQKFGDRPALTVRERKAYAEINNAVNALEKNNKDAAREAMEKVAAIFGEKGADVKDGFDSKRAIALAADIKDTDVKDYADLSKIADSVRLWRTQLQSVGNGPLMLMQRAADFEAVAKMTPEKVKLLVSNAVMDMNNAQRALPEIIEAGAAVVPELINNLRQENHERVANAHYILHSLGQDIVPALCSVLQSNDQLLLQQVSLILGDIKPVDARSLPFLKAVFENKTNNSLTREIAASSLRKITGKDAASLAPASDYFLREADRYYIDGPQVASEFNSFGGSFWVWDNSAANGKGGLVEVKVPEFLLTDLLAEELAYRGMELAKDKKPFQVLLGCILLQEKAKIDVLTSVAASGQSSDENLKMLTDKSEFWGGRLKDNLLVAYTLGLKNLAGVLEKSLQDGKSEISIAALEGIEAVGGDKGWQLLGNESSALIEALNSKNVAVAISAANTLVAIRMPLENQSWQKVVDVLVVGVGQRYTTVVEVIASDLKFANRICDYLEEEQVMPLRAGSGVSGVRMAGEYPLKDVLVIDNSIDEFDMLEDVLKIRQVRHNKTLPLVIISSRSHLLNIANQFARNEISTQANSRHLDPVDIVSGKNVQIDSAPWQLIIRNDVKADDEKLFNEIIAQKNNTTENVPIIVLTNPLRAERLKLKEQLVLAASNFNNPGESSEYMRIAKAQNVMNDIFGLRSSAVPVFVDEEIAGYNSMKVIQQLRQNPVTAGLPVAVLSAPKWLGEVKTDFELFEKDGLVRIMSSDISGAELIAAVNELKEKNELSKGNFARALNDTIALNSASALSLVGAAAAGKYKLTPAQKKVLIDGAKNKNSPSQLRVAVVKALGDFKVVEAVAPLKALFSGVDKKESELRATIVRAVAEIDESNREIDFKLMAMTDEDVAVRKAAAEILGPAAISNEQLSVYMQRLRPNRLLELKTMELKAAEK